MDLSSTEIVSGDRKISIVSSILAQKSEIISNRRWFHQHPELAFSEFDTAAKIVEHLRNYGITEIMEKCGRTGVVAMIHGDQPGPCIALRADIDALPLTETGDLPYKSQNEGKMHACGHDGHICGLLSAAKVLNSPEVRAVMKGSVKLLFQPGEEGYAGAREMIKDGCLEGNRGFGPIVDSVSVFI